MLPKPQMTTWAPIRLRNAEASKSGCIPPRYAAQRPSFWASRSSCRRRAPASSSASACSATGTAWSVRPEVMSTSAAKPAATVASGPAPSVWTQRRRGMLAAAASSSGCGFPQTTSTSASRWWAGIGRLGS